MHFNLLPYIHYDGEMGVTEHLPWEHVTGVCKGVVGGAFTMALGFGVTLSSLIGW